MFIRTERLFLRPGWPEDWEELLAQIGDQHVVRNLVRAPWPYTAEDAREFARRAQDGRYPHFLVTLPGQNGSQLVGVSGIHAGTYGIEFGHWIARTHWGRGFATEAGRAVLQIARVLGHREIHARHFVDNPASGRVLVKLGFRPTGERCMLESPGRAAPAETIGYVCDLGSRSDCDGSGSDPVPAMRAA